jgi:inorganic pyrophosphatase
MLGDAPTPKRQSTLTAPLESLRGSTDRSIKAFASVRASAVGSEPKDGSWRTWEVQKTRGSQVVSTGSLEKPWKVKSLTEAHIPVLIEVERGSRNKYELNQETGQMVLQRVLSRANSFPGDYGHVLQTMCEDGDPLAVLIVQPAECGMMMHGLDPGVMALCRIVGVVDLEDEYGHDEKIVAVLDDPRFDHITELEHISPHLRKEVQHFFENYKKLEVKNGKQQWAKTSTTNLSRGKLRPSGSGPISFSVAFSPGASTAGSAPTMSLKSRSQELGRGTVTTIGGKTRALQVLQASRESFLKNESQVMKLSPFVNVAVPPNLLHAEQTFNAFADASPRSGNAFSAGDATIERNVLCYMNVATGSTHSYVYRMDTTYRHYKYTLPIPYPGDYGWICQTWQSETKKALEILVVSSFPMVPESLAEVRVIGALQREFVSTESDSGTLTEYKILGVAVSDPRMDTVQDLKDLPRLVLLHIKNFFKTTNELSGCMDYTEVADLAADDAMNVIRDAHECYRANFTDRVVHNSANLQCLPWYPVAEDGSREFPAVIECPAQSSVRYLFDRSHGALRYDHPLATGAHWPCNLGFIPQTAYVHERPLEVMVWSSVPLRSKCVVDVRIIGAAVTQCEYGPDTKVFAVPKSEPSMSHWKDMSDVPGRVKDDIVEFLNGFRDLEESWKFSRFEQWLGPEEALSITSRAHERFFISSLPMQRMEAKFNAMTNEIADLRRLNEELRATRNEVEYVRA